MSLRLAVALVAALALLAAVTAAPAAAATCGAPADRVPVKERLAEARAATLCLVNAERARHGIKRLRPHHELQRSSQRYAGDMVAHRFFSHSSPGGAGLLERLRRAGRYLDGARGFAIGENLAWGTGALATPREIVLSWMGSPGHRRNVLDRRFREVGLGIALGTPRAGGAGATYANQFGVRR